jgi:2-hydroxychromene-2-carboxylate isomerase
VDTPAVEGPRADSGVARAQEAPVFYFDLGNPECYLVAERISERLPVPADWVPLAGARGNMRVDRALIERLASERELQPLRWPTRWPPRTDLAARAATYARSIGRVTAFSLAAFRQAFAGGRDLDDIDTVVIAGAACEIHPAALLTGIDSRSTRQALRDATVQADAAGARSLPAIALGGLVFEGDRGLDQAARKLGADE